MDLVMAIRMEQSPVFHQVAAAQSALDEVMVVPARQGGNLLVADWTQALLLVPQVRQSPLARSLNANQPRLTHAWRAITLHGLQLRLLPPGGRDGPHLLSPQRIRRWPPGRQSRGRPRPHHHNGPRLVAFAP